MVAKMGSKVSDMKYPIGTYMVLPGTPDVFGVIIGYSKENDKEYYLSFWTDSDIIHRFSHAETKLFLKLTKKWRRDNK